MMKIEEIEHEWEKDCAINSNELDYEALNIPKLHNKYLKFYNKVRLIILQLEGKLTDESNIKTLYFTGKLPKEELIEYNLEPFPYKVLRNDVKSYLESDSKIKQIKTN